MADSAVQDERTISHVQVSKTLPNGNEVFEVVGRKWFFGVRIYQAQFFDPTFQQWFWGVGIWEVFPGTPASSKVEAGDIVTRVNGFRVETVSQFIQQLEFSATGYVSMRVRDVNTGAYFDFFVQLLPYPSPGPGPGPGPLGP